MRKGAVRHPWALQPLVLESVTAAAVWLTVAGPVWFRRSSRPQAAAEVVDNLEPHIHPAPTNLERVAARAISHVCSIADVAGDVPDRPTIGHKHVNPAGHPASGNMSE